MNGKFCPACQLINDYYATQCAYCSALLVAPGEEFISTSQVKDETDKMMLAARDIFSVKIDPHHIPPGDVYVYIAGVAEGIHFVQMQHLLIGRNIKENVPEPSYVLDLANYDGVAKGVSRMHAEISRNSSGDNFLLNDLASTNGTCLNEERVIVGKSYPLSGMDIVSVGQVKLMVLFCPASTRRAP